MSRLSINEITTYRWSFEEDVACYQSAGVAGIGVWRQKLADYGEDHGRSLLATSSLKVSSLHWAGGFTGSDGRTHAESVRDGIEALQLAADLRAECLVIYSGGRNGHTTNHARRLFLTAIDRLLPHAIELDVPLAIEPMHANTAGEWTFLTSLDDTLELISTVGSDYLKFVLDTYHFGHDAHLLEQLSELAPHLAAVHLGDAHAPPDCEQNRVRLGFGRVPLGEIIGRLEELNYQGMYEVELLGEEIETRCYKRLLEESKTAVDELLASVQSKSREQQALLRET